MHKPIIREPRGRSVTPLMYPIKHVFRNWKLFTALLIGIVLAATFFSGVCVKANVSAEQSLNKQLSSVITDMDFRVSLNRTNLPLVINNLTSINNVKNIDYTATFYSPVRIKADNYTSVTYYQFTSFPLSSPINTEWVDKPIEDIPANYTYIIAGGELARKFKIGDNLTTSIDFPTPKYFNTSTVNVNLTVAGYATLTDKGFELISGNDYYYPGSYGTYRSDLMLISWQNTLDPLWRSTLDSSIVEMRFAINVDRENLISPWNVEASITNINLIADSIQNQILGYQSVVYVSDIYLNNALTSSLYSYQYSLSGFLVSFLFVSIPIFFVAWYLGLTVSGVSFNIRRREIGLLSTKGLSSGQIQRMFLGEALIIGLIGGFLGVIGGLIINQYYAGSVNLNNLFTSKLYSPEIMVVTIVFGVILSLLSVFWSSRKASRIPAVEALRNDLTLDGQQHRRIIPVIAIILGSYKLVVYAMGVDIPTLFNQWLYQGGNIFLSILQMPVTYFDMAMTYIGPFLFLWGITTLLIRDSTKFQIAVSKISSVMGDLGALAAKNIRRNPARLTAIAFVIALILCLAVQVTGQIASQQDYIQRTVQAQVGADININLGNASLGQIVVRQLLTKVSGIENATVERILHPQISDNYGSTTVKTIDPTNWAQSAHYEDSWFGGNNVDTILQIMKADNNTIVLSRTLAKQYQLGLGDYISINFDSGVHRLKIVGFFGPEPSSNSGPILYDYRPNSKSGMDISTGPIYYYGGGYNSPYDCYAPRDLFNVTYVDSKIYQQESFTTNILIKLKPGVNGTEVAQQIRSMDLDISMVTSYDEAWQSSNNLENSVTYSSLQTLDIQNFGLIFAVISASVGTALIAIVSLKERSREATLMSVRGLSFRQLVWMFLVESIAIITFAIILGVIVGIIAIYGTIASTNASTVSWNLSLVTQRLIYPADAVATIATYAALIYASTIGAIIVMSSQYVTKLEKMVRTR
jgi:ABC-type lipoprotein release transport system permease subunit